MAPKPRQRRPLPQKTADDPLPTERLPSSFLVRRSPMVQPMTMEASAVLLLAILTAWLWNYMKPDVNLLQQQSFIDLFCRQPDTTCLGSMLAIGTATGTTIASKQLVRKSTIVLKVPRSLQIWDEDALKDDSIQKILGNLEHPLDKAAVLALFLARWQRRLRDDDSFRQGSLQEQPVLVSYLLRQLPDYEHFESYHPVLWDDVTLTELLRRSSLSFAFVKEIQRQIHDEFTSVSDHIERRDYYAARLSVLTRSFGTATTEASGSYAMVPILDSFDHRTPPNVGFTTQHNGDYVVTALANFRGNIHDNYGKRSDPNLFARYGFVNGDGTEYTQAGINLWHLVKLQDDIQGIVTTPVDEQYRIAILRYLQYDDGYPACVGRPEPNDAFAQNAWRLKELKYKYLLHRAHSHKHWVILASPRNKDKKGTAPELDQSNVQFNATMVFATCRVLSLTHEDYDGEAITLLETHMRDLDYALPATHDGLEFRTLFCMSRMSSTAMERFATTIDLEKELIAKLDHGSPQWMAAHLRLGELQTLQALKHVSFSKLRANYGANLLGSSPAYSMRDQPCLKEDLMPLLS